MHRIVLISSEEEIVRNGIVEGYDAVMTNGRGGGGAAGSAVYVVREAVGVNMRNPISGHIWTLAVGLMRVAPRPIEIVVAREEVDAADDDDGEEQQEEEKVVVDAVMDGGYYQLEMGGGGSAATNNNSDLSPIRANLHHLPVSPGSMSSRGSDNEDAATTTTTSRATIMRNPFDDIDRFGVDRRITFHTQSLGIKLHRSPTEGIVHILHVNNNNSDTAPSTEQQQLSTTREGPSNGHLEAGDVILEVGGVDLRGKAIGPLEWADMVHFVRHIGRPLEILDAKVAVSRVGVVM